MASQLTAINTYNSRRTKSIKYSMALSGNFPGANGEPINLTGILNPKFLGGVNPGEVPKQVPLILSVPDGYTADVIPGQTPGTLTGAWAIRYFTAEGTLLPTAAYPAALTATPTVIEIEGSNYRI